MIRHIRRDSEQIVRPDASDIKLGFRLRMCAAESSVSKTATVIYSATRPIRHKQHIRRFRQRAAAPDPGMPQRTELNRPLYLINRRYTRRPLSVPVAMREAVPRPLKYDPAILVAAFFNRA
jgi:hypothetical protein